MLKKKQEEGARDDDARNNKLNSHKCMLLNLLQECGHDIIYMWY